MFRNFSSRILSNKLQKVHRQKYQMTTQFPSHILLVNKSSLMKGCQSSIIFRQYHIDHDFDPVYPGTAVNRMLTIRERVKSLTEQQLNGNWATVRHHLLWAGGLKDSKGKPNGVGNTERAFNDFNHCDLVAVKEDFVCADSVANKRGLHIATTTSSDIHAASERDLGPGGSWTTCMVGCSELNPSDSAHTAFKARIAFKLVWVPNKFESFVLVDDEGMFLNKGTPSGQLPDLLERMHNYKIVQSSKYSTAANILSTCAHRPASLSFEGDDVAVILGDTRRDKNLTDPEAVPTSGDQQQQTVSEIQNTVSSAEEAEEEEERINRKLAELDIVF